MINRENIIKALPYTIPVMAGYISLGIAYGLLMQQNGYGPLWALATSLFVYAGSAQFLGVSLLAAHASLAQVAVLILVLNFRHFFYGLSMITKYRDTGARKPYLIFGLTDETYAILSTTPVPEGMRDRDFYMLVTLMDHCYWVLGSVIGATIGEMITINTDGLDFAMTALFAVLFVEQWKTHKDHRAQLIGLGIILISLKLFGADNFLIPGLIVISVILLVMDHFDAKRRTDDENDRAEEEVTQNE